MKNKKFDLGAPTEIEVLDNIKKWYEWKNYNIEELKTDLYNLPIWSLYEFLTYSWLPNVLNVELNIDWEQHVIVPVVKNLETGEFKTLESAGVRDALIEKIVNTVAGLPSSEMIKAIESITLKKDTDNKEDSSNKSQRKLFSILIWSALLIWAVTYWISSLDDWDDTDLSSKVKSNTIKTKPNTIETNSNTIKIEPKSRADIIIDWIKK